MARGSHVRLVVLAMCAAWEVFGPSRVGTAQDGGAIVDAVAMRIGAASLRTVQFDAAGFAYAFAQNYRPDVPYPKFHATYTRAIDFERGLSREETIRTQFETPPRGGGGQPLYREARAAAVVSEASPWGGGALALTPHGFVRAAQARRASLQVERLSGRPVTLVSVTLRDKYRVRAHVDAQQRIERIDTWVANPILGDTLITTTFSDYRTFGDVQFPMRIVQQQGGYPTLEVTLARVQPNAAVTITPPAAASPQPARTTSTLVAPGVWYLAGTPDPNSQLIEFADFTVLVESSVSEARALANLAEARRLVPGKPVRYHVNSHHHGDHAAGVRAFVSEGLTIISHGMNRTFYEKTVLASPHTLEPDALTARPATARFIWVKDQGKYVISDRTRTMEVYHVPNGHAANLLMSYLPAEKLLLITDIYNDFGEPRPNDPPAGIVTPYYAALRDRIRELKLDVQRLAPSHGRAVNDAQRYQALVTGTVQAPAVVPPAGSTREGGTR